MTISIGGRIGRDQLLRFGWYYDAPAVTPPDPVVYVSTIGSAHNYAPIALRVSEYRPWQ